MNCYSFHGSARVNCWTAIANKESILGFSNNLELNNLISSTFEV